MIARATANGSISTILLGPIINYVASCLIEMIKTFLERDAICSSVHIRIFDVEKALYNKILLA